MTIAPPDYQMQLLQVPPSFTITKNAQARNAYGTVASELVCAALGATPIRIHGGYEACFDAHCNDTYYEIKSVKRNGKVVIYDWRMGKEARSGVKLLYAILLHNVRGSDGRKLVSDFINGGLTLLVLPAASVHAVAARQQLRKLLQLSLDPRNGYTRRGYKEGYRNVPVAALRTLACCETILPCTYAGLQFDITLCQPR